MKSIHSTNIFWFIFNWYFTCWVIIICTLGSGSHCETHIPAIYTVLYRYTLMWLVYRVGGTNLLSHTFCPPYKENTHFNPSQGFLSGPERREILLEICAMSSSNAFFCPLHEKSCFFKSPLLMLWHMSFLFNICPLSLSIVMSKSCSFHQCCESGTCKFWSEISVENLSALITNNTVHTGTSLYDVQFK